MSRIASDCGVCQIKGIAAACVVPDIGSGVGWNIFVCVPQVAKTDLVENDRKHFWVLVVSGL
jgi:hypothetical protein